LPLDEAVVEGRLDNGFRYFIRENLKPEARAELWLAVNAGSMQEDEDQLGLAHFVEHLAFNGTRNFEKQELVDYLESIGMQFGPDVNAFTSFDETVYILKVPTDDETTLATAFQILEDWAHGLAFDEEEIDKERGVVIEEWRLGQGAESRIRDKQFPVLFKDSRYAERLPIGEVEILESAPYEAFRRFYRDWYRPDLMALIAVGDFETEVIEGLIRDHFARLSQAQDARRREIYPVPDHREALFSIVTDPEATMTTVGVYYKLGKRPQGSAEEYRRQLVEQLYHGMLNARLDELRQQADPPFIFGFSTSAGFVRSKDVYLQVAGVREGQVERGLQALLTEAERVDRWGFTATELERAKKDLLRGFEKAHAERDKRESASFAGEYLRHFLEAEPSPGIGRELAMVQEFLPTITLDELNDLAGEWITEGNRVDLLSGPEKQEVALPSEAELAAVFTAASEAPIEAYVDRIREAPLLPNQPTPGSIAEEVFIEELGVTEWHLENGVRVVLKPTDFKNDQVLISGFSPGGHSLVSDQQYNSATFATTILGEGGLGDFNQIELEKALAGKVVSLSPSIGELEEGISGSASPQDLETLFQLLHLTFTSPRADQEAFQALMTRMQAVIDNRLSRPEAVFGDEIQLATYRGHPRRLPISKEILADVDLETAVEIYRERFADAGDFTFVLVGNFEPETLRPLVETYLGSLPTTGRQESWRDVGADPAPGEIKVTVHKGLEPKSQVRLVYRGPAEWSRENVHDIRSLAAAFRIRLREVLREDMGATYSVGVGGSISARPKQRFAFSVSFGCAPENVEEMIATVKTEIEKLLAAGLDSTYTDKVQEIQRRQRETDLKENGFWLGSLELYYTYGLDPRLILDHDALVARVTPENLKLISQRYLTSDNYTQAILYPEGWDEEQP
jgi:zinc protease